MAANKPRSFGDPYHIDYENEGAKRRGISLGCGGCIVLAFFGMICAVGLAIFMLAIMRSEDVCTVTLDRARQSQVMKDEIGEPMTMGWLVTGSFSTAIDQSSADVSVPISGPKGGARIHTVASREGKGDWKIAVMEARIENSGKVVDLR